MNRHRGWLSGVIALVLAAGVWGQGVNPAGDSRKPDEDPVKKALEEFSKKYTEGVKAKNDDMRLQALDFLQGYLTDKRVLDALSKVIAAPNETPGVKSKCANMLGQSGNPAAIAVLEKAFKANEKNECATEMVRQIGGIQDKAALKVLENIIKPRMTSYDDEAKIGIAATGLEALGRLRYTETVELLMKLLEQIEAGKPAKDAQIPPDQAEKEQRRNRVEGAAIGGLTALTAQNLGTFEEWKNWWKENKKTFKIQ